MHAARARTPAVTPGGPKLRVIAGGRQGKPARRTKDLAGFIDWFWPLYCYVPPDQWPPPETWPVPPPRLRVAR